MNDECLQLSTESGKCGDEYYRAKTKWLTAGRTKELGDKRHALALIYENALNTLLVSLKARLPTKPVQEGINLALDDKLLLAKDIKLLVSR